MINKILNMINKILNILTSFIPLFWNKYLTISILSFLILVVYLLKFSKTCYNPNDESGYECSSISNYNRTTDIETITGGGEYIAFQGLFGTISNIIITCITVMCVLLYILSSVFDYEQYWILRLTVISIITFIINYILNGRCPDPDSEVLYTCDGERNKYYVNWNNKILWLLLTISILSFLIYWRKVKNGSITIMGESNISETPDVIEQTITSIGEPVQFPNEQLVTSSIQEDGNVQFRTSEAVDCGVGLTDPNKESDINYCGKGNTEGHCKIMDGECLPIGYKYNSPDSGDRRPIKRNNKNKVKSKIDGNVQFRTSEAVDCGVGLTDPNKESDINYCGKGNTEGHCKIMDGECLPIGYKYNSPDSGDRRPIKRNNKNKVKSKIDGKFKDLEEKILTGKYDSNGLYYDNNLTESENIIANQRGQSIYEINKIAQEITNDIDQLVTPEIKSGGHKVNTNNTIRDLYIHKYKIY